MPTVADARFVLHDKYLCDMCKNGKIVYILRGRRPMSMRTKVQVIKPDGSSEEQDGTVLDVSNASEPWSEYSLEDGTRIRTRQMMIQIVRLDQLGPDQKPQYSLQIQPVISIIESAQ